MSHLQYFLVSSVQDVLLFLFGREGKKITSNASFTAFPTDKEAIMKLFRLNKLQCTSGEHDAIGQTIMNRRRHRKNKLMNELLKKTKERKTDTN